MKKGINPLVIIPTLQHSNLSRRSFSEDEYFKINCACRPLKRGHSGLFLKLRCDIAIAVQFREYGVQPGRQIRLKPL